MLVSALDMENTDVYLKLHPETIAGAKGGNLTTIEKYKNRNNLHIIDMPANVISIIKQVDEVYVMTSGVGLEALILNKPVTCFGFPFYAGWGLTHDMIKTNNPRKKITLEALIYAVFVKYTHWFHPETKKTCEMETAIEWVINNKKI